MQFFAARGTPVDADVNELQPNTLNRKYLRSHPRLRQKPWRTYFSSSFFAWLSAVPHVTRQNAPVWKAQLSAWAASSDRAKALHNLNSSARAALCLSGQGQPGSHNNSRLQFWLDRKWRSPFSQGRDAYKAIAAAFETFSDPNPPAASIFTN